MERDAPNLPLNPFSGVSYVCAGNEVASVIHNILILTSPGEGCLAVDLIITDTSYVCTSYIICI